MTKKIDLCAFGETGAEELRRVVRVLDMCRESALDGYTAEELIALVRACWASPWDVLVDELTPDQCHAVIHYGAPIMFREAPGRCGSILIPIEPIPFVHVCPCGADFGTPNAHGESWCSAGCGFYVTDASEARRGTAIPMEEVSE